MESERWLIADRRPAELCDAFRALQPHCQLADLLPNPEELSTLRRVCLSHSIPSASFAVFTYSFDPSHIPASTSDAAHQSSQPYLRAIAAACHCLVQDRSLTQSRSYLLSDFILVSHLIKSVLTEAPEPQTLEVRDLQALLQVCEASITLEISRVLPEVKTQWHSSAITSLQDSHEPGDLVATSLQTILEWAKAGPALPGSHCKQAIASTIRSIIQHRSDSPSQSAETWLSFIRRQSSTDVDFAASLLEACGPFLLDLPQFQRMQLQLASDLSGVKAADANTKGEALLRQLLASSPPYDSATELLPKQRAIFVIKALQQWLLDDSVEDLNDTVLGHLMGLLSHLAPTLQDVEGSHWDFSFDIAETVFDVSSSVAICCQ